MISVVVVINITIFCCITIIIIIIIIISKTKIYYYSSVKKERIFRNKYIHFFTEFNPHVLFWWKTAGKSFKFL